MKKNRILLIGLVPIVLIFLVISYQATYSVGVSDNNIEKGLINF